MTDHLQLRHFERKKEVFFGGLTELDVSEHDTFQYWLDGWFGEIMFADESLPLWRSGPEHFGFFGQPSIEASQTMKLIQLLNKQDVVSTSIAELLQ